MYDIIIIGGGPAGAAAAVYTARKRLKTLLITETFGGQSIVSDDIQNWIGEPHVSGYDLAKKLEAHVRGFPDIVDVKMPGKAVKVEAIKCASAKAVAPTTERSDGGRRNPRGIRPTTERSDGGRVSPGIIDSYGVSEPRVCDFLVTTDKNATYEGKAVILAAGARRRRLGVPGEDKFDGKGVAFCSTCDAPLFSGKKVAVVGGGNAGLEAVVDLFPYAEGIYLCEYGELLKGDPVTQEEVKRNSKVEIVFNAKTLEIMGEKFVTGLKYLDTKTNEEKILAVDGVFVEVGSVPNSEMVRELVKLDKYGQVAIDSKHASTSHPGVFAAGDITDDPYKQNNISAGDAVKAALAAYNYLLKREKTSPAAEPN